MSKFPKTIRVHVTQNDIVEGKCADPNKCMVKLAIKREIGGHGYVHVEGGVVSITRRPDYREKGFMPRTVMKKVIEFDQKKEVRPFYFNITFYKSSKITAQKSAEKNKTLRAKPGYKAKKYNMRRRIAGMALGGVAAAA